MVLDPWVISQRLFMGEAEQDTVFAEIADELGIGMADKGNDRLKKMAEDVAKNEKAIREKRAQEAKEAQEREDRARGN
jgi:hypothetical protein